MHSPKQHLPHASNGDRLEEEKERKQKMKPLHPLSKQTHPRFQTYRFDKIGLAIFDEVTVLADYPPSTDNLGTKTRLT